MQKKQSVLFIRDDEVNKQNLAQYASKVCNQQDDCRHERSDAVNSLEMEG